MVVSSESPRPASTGRTLARAPSAMDQALWTARAPVWAPCPAAADRPISPSGRLAGPTVAASDYLDPAGLRQHGPNLAPGQGAFAPPAMLQLGDVRYVRVFDAPPVLVGDLGGMVGTQMLPPAWQPGNRVPRTPSRRPAR